jgi:hypothetical protein
MSQNAQCFFGPIALSQRDILLRSTL